MLSPAVYCKLKDINSCVIMIFPFSCFTLFNRGTSAHHTVVGKQSTLHVCSLITCEENVKLISHGQVHSASSQFIGLYIGHHRMSVFHFGRLSQALKVGNLDLSSANSQSLESLLISVCKHQGRQLHAYNTMLAYTCSGNFVVCQMMRLTVFLSVFICL